MSLQPATSSSQDDNLAASSSQDDNLAASSSQDENPAATTSQDDKVRNSPVVALMYALSYFGLYWIEFFGIISACPIHLRSKSIKYCHIIIPTSFYTCT